MKTNRNMHSGFTLIEMALVLAILAMVAGGGLSLFSRNIESQKRQATERRMTVIMDAIREYVIAFGALPCPANKDDAPTASTFGVAGDNATPPDNCTADFADVEVGGVDVMVVGMVPVGTLGLHPSYAIDGWNRKFTYAVDEDLTTQLGFDANDGDIKVADESGDSLIGAPVVTLWPVNTTFDSATQGAVLALISHGRNGHGAARTKTGAIVQLPTPSTMEDNNALDSTTAGLSMTGNFYIKPFDESGGANNFDDIVDFRTKWQLAN